MDYQQFLHQLPNFSENGMTQINSSSNSPLQTVFDQLSEQKTTISVLQLLNAAVHHLEAEEIYCQVGCFPEALLVGALFNHPETIAYTVDNLADTHHIENPLEKLSDSLEQFEIAEQVIFCEQEVSEFVTDLNTFAPETNIGVYFYNGSPDYRSVFLSLLLILPFLGERAIIILNNSNWSSVQQACRDFLATQPHSQLLLNLPTPHAHYPTFGNGLQVISWDQSKLNDHQVSSQPPFIAALKQFSREFETQEKVQVINQLYQEATRFYQNQQLHEAKTKYQEIITWSSNHSLALHDLGLIYFQEKQYQPALNYLQQALGIAPLNALWHYHYAIILEQAGQKTKAVSSYQTAIHLDRKLIDAYNNLGKLYTKHGNFTEAESLYREAIKQNSEHFGSYVNLGNLLLKLDRAQEAIEVYQTALTLKPNDTNILHNLEVATQTINDPAKRNLNLGKVAYQQKRYQDAIRHYQTYLEETVGTQEVYLHLADSYYQQKQDQKVIETYQEAIHTYPENSHFYYLLAKTLQKLGRIEEAITVANEAATKFPQQLRIKLLPKRLIPIIYNDVEEIAVYRTRYIEALEALIQGVDLETEEGKKEAFHLIDTSNFFLQYQGKNDLELKKKYGQFVHEVMKANYPQWTQSLVRPHLGPNQKIRVGYVSNNLSFHTIGKLAVGWLKHHNKELLEVYCYHLGSKTDSMTQQFYEGSHGFRHITEGFTAICEQILADELDILVYIDVGLDIKVTQLAGLRLAPIQCQTWLHPITSGMPTIDYFLSSDLMEAPNGEQHYAEKLIRLPNLGIAYPKPTLPTPKKSRAEFNLPEDAVIYLCCQSTYKYLPQHDEIFPRIAQEVKNAKFVFLHSPISRSLDETFQRRLGKAFARFNLEIDQYCIFFPRLLPEDYLCLNLVSDVFLDTLGWSGGNTTLEAIACDLPIVTCPGEFMRGRHSYGILKMLGVTETIAENREDYIKIAVRLGVDPDWRDSIREKINQCHGNLYEDQGAVRGLEGFYERILAGER